MGMSHRERFLTAIDLGEPDLVPITDLGLDPPIVEVIMGRKIGGAGLSLLGGAAWEASVENRIALSEACLKLGFDAVPAVSDYTLSSKGYRPKALSRGRFIDEWGRVMEPRAETKTTWWTGGTVETEEEIEGYTPPNPEEEGRFELVERVIKTLKGKDAAIIGQAHSGWHMAFQVRGGIDRLLIDMYRRRELTHRFMDKIAMACLGMAKQMIEGGVDVIFVTDDYADCHSPFMTMEQFREFELPNIRRLVDYAASKGVPVLKHTDGNIYPILDDMVEAGIRGIHPIE
ncbi:MAG: uroporphyrinogen decarboxylase family protein, partial [Candidatus Bathyarchaeia archaeon]